MQLVEVMNFTWPPSTLEALSVGSLSKTAIRPRGSPFFGEGRLLKTKICNRCKRTLPISEFHRDRTTKSGHYSLCKDCKREHDSRRHPKSEKTLDRERLLALGLKRCGVCGIPKKPEEFDRQPRGSFGRTSTCKDCVRIRNQEWREAHPDYQRQWRAKNKDKVRASYERRKEYYRQWRIKNRDKVNAYLRQWRADNPKKARSYTRKWREKNPDYFRIRVQRLWNDPEFREHHRLRTTRWRRENPEKTRAIKARRRAREAGVASNFTAKDWANILDSQGHRCKYCDRPFSDKLKPTVDHVIPLSKGGTNTPANIVVSCKPCNSRKRDRMPRQLRLGLLKPS